MSRQTIVRYSEAFKMDVVREVEAKKLSIQQAKKKYGIPGNGTVENWIKKLGRDHLLPRRVRIEKVDEVDRIKKLEEEKQQLESALAQAHLKMTCLESVLKIAEDETGIDFKKNYASKASPRSAKARKSGRKSGRLR